MASKPVYERASGARRAAGRSRRLRVLAVTLLAAFGAGNVLAPVPYAVADEHEVVHPPGEHPDFPLVASIPITGPDGSSWSTSSADRLFLDEIDRKLLLVLRSGNSPGVAVVDPDALTQEAFVPTSGLPGRSLRAYDPIGKRLFYGSNVDTEGWSCSPGLPAPQTVCNPSLMPAASVTTVTLDLAERASSAETYTLPAGYRGHNVKAATYDAERGVLLVVTQAVGHEDGSLLTTPLLNSPEPGPYSQVTVHAITDAQLASGSGGPQWSYRVPGCPRLLEGGGRPPFFGLSSTGDFVYTACAGRTVGLGAEQSTIQHGAVRVDFNGADVAGPLGDAGAREAFTSDFFPVGGELDEAFAFGDPAGDRVVVVLRIAAEGVLVVFDAKNRAWTGRLVTGDGNLMGGTADAATGRLYFADELRGWIVADGASVPMAQGTAFRQRSGEKFVNPLFDPATRRLFYIGYQGFQQPDNIQVWEDRVPPRVPEAPPDPDAGTNDIDEALASQVTHSGGASAFGSRLMWVGGPRGMPQIWPIWFGQLGRLRPQPDDWGLFLGRVVETELRGDRDGGSASAAAVGAEIDDDTEQYLDGLIAGPFEESGGEAPDDLRWSQRKEGIGEFQESECRDFGDEDDPRADQRDGSAVVCAEREQVAARAVSSESMAAGGLQVGYSSSETTTWLHPDGGLVSEATATARDVALTVPGAGSLYIGEITSTATALATGRPEAPGREPGAPGANTEHKVEMRNVAIVGANGERFTCAEQCDPAQVVRAINNLWPPTQLRADGPRRATDEASIGSPGGARAVIGKDRHAAASDLVMNGDAQPEVYGLQLTYYNDARLTSRFVLQLAAVYADTQYRIGGLAPEAVPEGPASLAIELLDQAGEALAGGMFEIRSLGALPEAPAVGDEADGGSDPNGGGENGDGESENGNGETEDGANGNGEAAGFQSADVGDDLGGVLGLDAALIDGGVCITGGDGIGDCTFEDLEPGTYSITQTGAPDGYFAADALELPIFPGETTVTFTNLRAAGAVGVVLADDSDPPVPLDGGEFALLAGGTEELARCTTAADGTCGFDDVPLGAYVVRQVAAPEEYQAADEVSFALAQPGQVAVLVFINGLEPIPGTEGGAGTVSFAEPPRLSGGSPQVAPVVSHRPSAPVARGGGLPGLINDVLELMARKPFEAALVLAVWLLLAAPAYLAARRRSLNLVRGVV